MRFRIALTAALLVTFGFGCQNVPTPEPAPGIVPPPDKTSEAPPGWARYKDPSGFQFEYPEEQGAEVVTDDLYPDSAIAINLGPTVRPEGKPSVPELSLHVLVLPSTDARLHGNCYLDPGWTDSEGIPAMEEMIAGTKGCLTEEGDAAAGNRYNSRSYGLPHHGGVIVFRFTVHSVACENYENPARDCVAFDGSRDFNMAGEIMKTVTINPGPWLGYAVQTHALTKNMPLAEYDVSYPSIEPEDDLGLRSANAFAKAAAAEFVSGFEEEAKDLVKEDVGAAGAYTLNVGGDVSYLSSEVISLIFRGSLYSGGAHPNATYQTILVDRKNGKTLELNDLFADSKRGMGQLVDRVRMKLNAENETNEFSDEDWIKTGTEGTAENYALFGFTDDGLLVIFPPYQVAAYAAGPFNVVIPWDELHGLLQERFIQK